MNYETNGWIKFVEEDNFENGCLPETSVAFGGNDTFKADTVEALLDKLNAFVGNTDASAVSLDACDEPGRIDIEIMENELGYSPNARELDAWKQGKCRLFLVNYSFHVEQVQRSAISLAA